MTLPEKAGPPTLLLMGNPNTGKSSVFGALTGTRQKVANFPGVTVEAKLGKLNLPQGETVIVDLPGTYSLAARSPDEGVAADALRGRLPNVGRPSVVMVVADAASLDRNLYLATQVLEYDLPVVIALTMVDVAKDRGITIDETSLARSLGVPVVKVNATDGSGMPELRTAVAEAIGSSRKPLAIDYPAPYAKGIDALKKLLANQATALGYVPTWPEAERLLVDENGPLHREIEAMGDDALLAEIAQVRASANGDRTLAMIEAENRYKAIRMMTAAARTQQETGRRTAAERIDAVLTHGLFGTLIFIGIMGVMFQSVYSWSAPAMDIIDGTFGAVAGWVEAGLAPGPLRGLLVDGVIAGVGGVLVFLPQILVLFLFISVLEDLGYMARAAFLMDRLLSRFGLSGRSFIPLLSSFACAIPGIMGARVVEDRRSRLTTIFIAPFMSCSARLPVYTLMIGAFVKKQSLGWGIGLQGLVLLSMYSIGFLVAIPTALVVQKGILRGKTTPFIMELPSFKVPRLRNVAAVMWQRGFSFVRRAGTIILAVSILVWALGYFPRNQRVLAQYASARRVENERHGPTSAEGTKPEVAAAHKARLAALDAKEAGALLRQSALGYMGRAIEPLVRPLGWDWRIGIAAISSLPAREVVVSSLGTIFNIGEVDNGSTTLKQVLKRAKRDDGTRLFTLATALSIMVFFALCAQCAATLAVMKRETSSVAWPLASFATMTTMAYLGALLTFQGATALGWGA